MRKSRWFLTLPLALIVTVGVASASSVKDNAGLFGADAIKQANAELNRIERENSISTTVETIDSLDGATVSQKAKEHAQQSRTEGVYVLIAKKEGKIDVISSASYRRAMNDDRLRTIENTFIGGLKKRDFDGALLVGVKSIDDEVSSARSEFGSLRQTIAPAAGRVGRGGRAVNRGGGFGIGSLLGIGLLVFGVLFVVRLVGSLMGGGRQGQGAMGPGGMGRPGYGQGYGGGGGGGFMSSMFGGIGGALAGNWLYDQFSGRNHGGSYNESSTTGDQGDAGNAGSDWSSGGDAGGGDWGGGGGGGDWGGGGGGDDGGSW